jgi:hypothetical protein
MSKTIHVALTEQQRDLLLRGLRFIRSSILFEPQTPSPEVAKNREEKLQEVSAMVDLLKAATPVDTAAKA